MMLPCIRKYNCSLLIIIANYIGNAKLFNELRVINGSGFAYMLRLKATSITSYIENVKVISKSTASQYERRLKTFSNFTMQKYGQDLDVIIDRTKKNELNAYEVLAGYANFLLHTGTVSANTLKQWVVTAKNLLEFYDIDISPKKFKLKVRLPKAIRKNKEALTKQHIVEILNSIADIRLKTYVLLLSATGMRATEALSIRLSDVSLDIDPPKIFVRGEYTKTKADRYVILTRELKAQLQTYITYKYRTRRTLYYCKEKNKVVSAYRTPDKSGQDTLFSVHKLAAPKSLYSEMRQAFAKTLDRMERGQREESQGVKHRKITLHSMRRYVKSTISDLGYYDYSEWFISHSGSTYYRKSEREKSEIFKKIEPYLTFLDYEELERKGADIASRLEEKDRVIQDMMRRQDQFEQLIQSLIDSGQL